MSTLSRICMGLAVFLLVAGGVYGVTSHEPAGTTLLLVASATFWFLAFVARHVAKQEEEGGPDEVEVHIAPTIWPFGFAIAAFVVALGLIVSSSDPDPRGRLRRGVRRRLVPGRRPVTRSVGALSPASRGRSVPRRPAPC